MTTRTEKEWDERFGAALESPEGSNFFETFGEDFEEVEKADPMTVWTVVEGDETENHYLLPGFHYVNRIGYVLSEKPITQAELDSGEWNEVLWLDAEEFENKDDDTPSPNL